MSVTVNDQASLQQGGGGDALTLNGFDGGYYRLRDNHTGTQQQSTVVDLEQDLPPLVAQSERNRFAIVLGRGGNNNFQYGTTLTNTGTLEATTTSTTDAWQATSKLRAQNSAGRSSLYTTQLTHDYPTNKAFQKETLVKFHVGIADTGSGAFQTFAAGEIGSISVVGVDVNPTTQNHFQGWIQSYSMANPNNIYLMINGSGAAPYFVDTGLVLTVNKGYICSIHTPAGSGLTTFTITDQLAGATHTHTVDITTLAANQRPTNAGGFAFRLVRNGNLNGKTEFASYKLEVRDV